MTLVQVLVDKKSVHMCTDFRLTHPHSGELVQDDAFKLVTISRKGWSATIGVTGIAYICDVAVGDWIAEACATIGYKDPLDEVFVALARADKYLGRISDPKLRRHTFVIAAMIGNGSTFALMSNFERVAGSAIYRETIGGQHLERSFIRPKKPTYFATGVSHLVDTDERVALLHMLRGGTSVDSIHQKLASVNRSVHGRDRSVSEGSYVASFNSEGKGIARPFLTQPPASDLIPPDFASQLKQAGMSINRDIDEHGHPKAIQVVGMTSVNYQPSPAYFKEAFDKRPDSSELWNNYGSWLSSQDRNNEAFTAYEKARELDPESLLVVVNTARLHWRIGNLKEAHTLFRSAVSMSEPTPPSDLLSTFAEFLFVTKRDEDEAERLHLSAAQDEQLPVAKARYAYFLSKTGRSPSHALTLIFEALDTNPDDPEILALAGRIQLEQRDLKAARELTLKSIAIKPDGPTLHMCAELLTALGEYKSAVYYFRKAAHSGVPLERLSGMYGLALLQIGKVTQALKNLRIATSHEPDEPDFLINLATGLIVANQTEEGLNILHTLVEQGLTNEAELERISLLAVASRDAMTEDYLHGIKELVNNGASLVNAETVRILSRKYSGKRRAFGYRIADLVEGRITMGDFEHGGASGPSSQ